MSDPEAQKTSSVQTLSLTADAVKDYLLQNPDFFLKHASLLENLRIPHGERGTVSLVERQIAQLRDRNQKLERHLQQFIENADANQAVYDRIGELAVALVETDSLESLLQTLCNHLADHFSVDAVAVELPDDGLNPLPEIAHPASGPDTAFDKPYLGEPPDSIEVASLFGERGAEIQSVAILPLTGVAAGGLLLLASNEHERFRPDLGTRLLTQVAALLSALLGRYLNPLTPE